jgi:hypothetical protein
MKNTFTTMEPPKIGALIHTCRQPQRSLREPQKQQKTEQQPPRPLEFVNLETIPLHDMVQGSPTPVV